MVGTCKTSHTNTVTHQQRTEDATRVEMRNAEETIKRSLLIASTVLVEPSELCYQETQSESERGEVVDMCTSVRWSYSLG
jgi:hypothetical protein